MKRNGQRFPEGTIVGHLTERVEQFRQKGAATFIEPGNSTTGPSVDYRRAELPPSDFTRSPKAPTNGDTARSSAHERQKSGQQFENRTCSVRGERGSVDPCQPADMREPVSAGTLEALVHVGGVGYRNDIDLPSIVSEPGRRAGNGASSIQKSLGLSTCMSERRWITGHGEQPPRGDIDEIDELEPDGYKVPSTARFHGADESTDSALRSKGGRKHNPVFGLEARQLHRYGIEIDPRVAGLDLDFDAR